MLTEAQLAAIYAAAGLYGDGAGVLSAADINACAHYVGAFGTDGTFTIGYERYVALEALRRFKLLASPSVLQPIESAVNQRIQELYVGPTRPLDGVPVEEPDANPEWVAEVRTLIAALVPPLIVAHNDDLTAHPDIERGGGGGGGEASPGSLTTVPLAAPVVIVLPATSTAAGSASGKPAVWSAWTDIVAHTVTEGGFYTLEAELDVSTDFPYGGGGRYFSETRIIRVRGAATTVIADRDDYHRNFDVGSNADHWTLVGLDEAEAQDEYKIMVRVRRQATAGGSALNTAAYNTTWTTECKLALLKDGVGGAAAMPPSGGDGTGVPAVDDLDNAATTWGAGADYYLVYDEGVLKKISRQSIADSIIDNYVEPWARTPSEEDPQRPSLPAAEVRTQYLSNDGTEEFTTALKTRLEGIDAGATRNTDTITPAERAKLAGIDTGAEVNPTPAEIKREYERNLDTNAFNNAARDKLAGIEDGAEVNPSDAEIKAAYERNNDTNAFTDADRDKVATYPLPDGTNDGVKVLKTDAAGTPAWRTDAGETEAEVNRLIAGHNADTAAHPAIPRDGGPSGPTLTPRTDEEIDDLIAAAEISITQLPGGLQVLNRAIENGGIKTWPNSDLQLAATPRAAPYTTAPAQLVWGSSTMRIADEYLTPANFLLRAAKSAYASRPTTQALIAAGMRLRTGSVDSIVLHVPTLTAIGQTSTHWLWNVAIAAFPAGDTTIILEQHTRLNLDIEIGAGDVSPSSLGIEGQGLLGVDGDGFTIEPRAGLSQAWSGSSGVTVTASNTASAIRVIELDMGIDLDTRGSGLLFFDLRATIPARSQTTLGFGEDNETETELKGQLSLQLIGFSAAYSPPGEVGVVGVRGVLYNSAVHVGDLVMRAAKDDQNRVQLVLRYDPDADNTQSGLSFSIGVQGRVFFLDYGTFAPELGDLGPGYVFEDALPPPAGYMDNDLAIVRSGTAQGVWVRVSTPTHGVADTGWGGKVIDASPVGTMRPVDFTVGADDFRYWVWSARDFPDPRGSGTMITERGGQSPNVPDLWYIVIGYKTPGNREGRIDIKYVSNRTYLGHIDITESIFQFLLNNVDMTSWLLANLTPGSVSHLLAGNLTVTEPDHVDSTVTPRWDKVAGLVQGTAPLMGTKALVEAGSDTLQRTWPAKVLADEIDRRAATDAPSVGTPALLTAGTDEIDRLWAAKDLADEMERRDNSRGLLLRSRLPTEQHMLDAEAAFPASAVWLCSTGFPPGNTGRTTDAALENRVYIRDGANLTGWSTATKYNVTEGRGTPTVYTSGRQYARLRALTTVTLGLFRIRTTWEAAGTRYWVLQYRGAINTDSVAPTGTAPAGTPALLTAGTDNTQRTWAASALAAEMDRRDNSYGAIGYNGLPPDDVIAGMLAASPEPLWYNSSEARIGVGRDTARENRTYVQIPPLYRKLFDGYGTSTAYRRSGPGVFTVGGNRDAAGAWVRLGGLVLTKGFWALQGRTLVGGLAVVEAVFLGQLPESDTPLVADTLNDLPPASGERVGKVAIVSSPDGAGLYRKSLVSRTFSSGVRRFTITPNRVGPVRGYARPPRGTLGSITPATTTITQISLEPVAGHANTYGVSLRFNADQQTADYIDIQLQEVRTSGPPRPAFHVRCVWRDARYWWGTVSPGRQTGPADWIYARNLYLGMAIPGTTMIATLGYPHLPSGFDFGGGNIPAPETEHTWVAFVAGIAPSA